MATFLRILRCMINQPNFIAPAADLRGKTILITGPTQGGIGFETARQLAARHAHVILAGRNPTSVTAAQTAITTALPQSQISTISLDLTSQASITTASTKLEETYGSFDVIICNAGAQFDRAQLTDDGIERTFATCALGHHQLLSALSTQRVVWITGDIYVLAAGTPDPKDTTTRMGMRLYARACLARLWLARELKRRVTEKADMNMDVVVVHPGVIASNFMEMSSIGRWVSERLLISPQVGAQASVLAASASSMDLKQDLELPYYHNKFGWMELAESDPAMDAVAARKLFDLCDELCAIERP